MGALQTNDGYLPFGPLKSYLYGNNLSADYTYDNRYLLKRIKNASLDYQYTPDATGAVKNIIGISVPELDPASNSYNYEPDSNRLDNRTGSNPADYTLDDNGNTVSDGTRSFIYDETNRLIRVEQDAAVVAQYGYDAFNRRTMKTVAGTTTLYHYDTNGLLLAETLTDGTPLRDYIYLQGQPFAVKIYQGQEARLYYYINDHLGTPQLLVDGSGQIVWQAAYLPFGKAVVVGSVTNNFRFAGQYFDDETGLHYNWHRYYDPEIGRYLRADPIGLAGGINPFVYSLNNPSNYIDPLGLDTWTGASVEADVAFILFGGYSRVLGWLTNRSTGEKCYYETTCKKVGFGIMAMDLSGSGNVVLNGPKQGQDLAGTSVGMGLDIGPVALAGSVDSNAAVNVAAGGGVGPLPGSGAMNAMVCKTRIIRCENTPCKQGDN